MRTKNQLLSNFILKVIALVTMTIDHIGMFMLMYSPNSNYDDPTFWSNSQNTVGYIFRIIGRLAFPIFAFLLAEAMHHSKNKVSYILRLGILGVIITGAEAVMVYGMGFKGLPANIFIDLSLGALAIYLLEKKNWFSLFAILPLAYNVLTFIANMFNMFNPSAFIFFPEFIRTQYSIYGFILMLGFYYCRKIARFYIVSSGKKTNVDTTPLLNSYYEENIKNIMCVICLTLFTIIFWLLTYIDISFDVYGMRFQSYAIIAGLFIFLYNGKRGYNAKWFQYASYLYYPLHLVIIYGVFYLIFMI